MKSRSSRSRRPEPDDYVVICARILPRASRNGITQTEDGSLKIRLTAPPVDGAANDALIRFLAEVLSIGRSQIEIVSGHTSRDKVLRIVGLSKENIRRVLNQTEK